MTDQSQQVAAEEDSIPERFVPEQMRGELVEAEHIGRYTWAAAFCEGRRVLDAGCGVGYGAELLNRAGAGEVVGVDNSESAIEIARASVSPGVSCELADVTELPFEDDSFDLVVCFEVIEHVADPERVLDEFARVVRGDGLVLVSSPNRDRYVPGNPHHVRELVRPELQAMLDARFPSARIISQHVMLGSVISWSGAPTFDGARTARMTDPAPEDELYLLAMAGGELPTDPGPVVTLGHFAEPRRWLDHIELQRRHIDDQTRLLEDLHGRENERLRALDRLAEAEAALARANARESEFEDMRKALEAARAALEVLDATREELSEAQRQLEAQTAELAQLRTIASSKSWQLTAPLRKVAARGRQL